YNVTLCYRYIILIGDKKMPNKFIKPIIVGNWKMNGLKSSIDELVKLIDLCSKNTKFDVVIAPPYTLLHSFNDLIKKNESLLKLGAQDCHHIASGSHTGSVSGEMIKDSNAQYVILGHSERRIQHKETNELVSKKAHAAQLLKLNTIICVGESLEDRSNGNHKEVIGRQLANSLPNGFTNKNTIVAYEPIWAIGSNNSASKEEINQMHKFIASFLLKYSKENYSLPIIYGGSVTQFNAKEIINIDYVNGLLVGGASLKADSFFGIIDAI
ncbi:triose-phosphate isomerase, partial [Hyphomicrobiales bacterium]|nr:triose-phosphate isomerase [Hyphomicrobiales bacterium]